MFVWRVWCIVQHTHNFNDNATGMNQLLVFSSRAATIVLAVAAFASTQPTNPYPYTGTIVVSYNGNFAVTSTSGTGYVFSTGEGDTTSSVTSVGYGCNGGLLATTSFIGYDSKLSRCDPVVLMWYMTLVCSCSS